MFIFLNIILYISNLILKQLSTIDKLITPCFFFSKYTFLSKEVEKLWKPYITCTYCQVLQMYIFFKLASRFKTLIGFTENVSFQNTV